MSAAAISNGNGKSRRDQFLARVSAAADCRKGETLPFAPDFLGSLVCRMASADLTESAMAWAEYRASGNASERAVHIYMVASGKMIETPLRQRDCALEVAWIRAGHEPEWLDAPLDLFREEAAKRGIEPLHKGLISRAFTENRQRGTIATDPGRDLTVVPAPKVADSLNKRGETKAKTKPYQAFLAERKVAYSGEFEEEEVARSTLKRIRQVRLSAYKKWNKSPAPQPEGGTSLEALEAPEALGVPASPEPPPQSGSPFALDRSDETTTTTSPPLKQSPPESQSSDVVVVAQKLGITKTAATLFLDSCRKQSPTCTLEEIAATIDEVEATIDRRQIRNPTGILLRAVPPKLAASKNQPQAQQLRCACGGELFTGGLCVHCYSRELRTRLYPATGVSADD